MIANSFLNFMRTTEPNSELRNLGVDDYKTFVHFSTALSVSTAFLIFTDNSSVIFNSSSKTIYSANDSKSGVEMLLDFGTQYPESRPAITAIIDAVGLSGRNDE